MKLIALPIIIIGIKYPRQDKSIDSPTIQPTNYQFL